MTPEEIAWQEQYDEKVKGYGIFMMWEVHYMNKARANGWMPFSEDWEWKPLASL